LKRNSNKLIIESSPKDYFFLQKKNYRKKIIVEFFIILRALSGLILTFFIKYLIKKIKAMVLYWGNFLPFGDQTKSSAIHCIGFLCEKNANITIFVGYNVSNYHI
jgi:hypothetical protein